MFMLFCCARMLDEVDQDEATACTLLKHMALNIYEHVGVRMHRLSVCQWEVKLWLDCDGQASGSWRVVVTNVTGHTCTVDVSSLAFELCQQS
jgi:acetyl-CoA carboxylase / biotin carboxylase 1